MVTSLLKPLRKINNPTSQKLVGFIKKGVQIEVYPRLECKVIIRNVIFGDKQEFEFGKYEAWYVALQISQEYEYEIIPKDDGYMSMIKSEIYNGDPQIELKIYRDHLKIYDRTGILPELDDIVDKDHPQREELIRLISDATD